MSEYIDFKKKVNYKGRDFEVKVITTPSVISGGFSTFYVNGFHINSSESNIDWPQQPEIDEVKELTKKAIEFYLKTMKDIEYEKDRKKAIDDWDGKL